MEEEKTIRLVQKAQEDSDAFVQLFDQYQPLIHRMLHTYHLPTYDGQDWSQEARIALLKAVRRYDGRSGSRFGSYFRLVLGAHLASLMRHALAKKRRGDVEALVVAEPIDRYREAQQAQAVENGLLIAIQVEDLFVSLSLLEARAVRYAIMPMTVPDRRLARAQERAKRKVGNFVVAFQH